MIAGVIARRAVLKTLAAAAGAAALSRPSQASEADDEERFVAWARGAATPVTDDFLIAAAGDARLIALGEFMHGAHEPLALRNRLIVLLAERGMIDAVALESGFVEGRRLNDYVMSGPGDAVAVARDGLTWGFGGFAENVALLDQLRRLNARPGVAKVALYGMDVPGGGDHTMGDGSIVVREAIDYLNWVATPTALALARRLRPFSHDLSCQGYFARGAAERIALGQVAGDLIAYMTLERPALTAASSAGEADWAERSARVFGQLVAMFAAWPADNVAGDTPKGMFAPSQIRDKAMADNTLWLFDRLGPGKRMLVFAANGHVWPVPSLEPMYPGFPGSLTNLGQHLYARLGTAMTAIVTGAGARPNAGTETSNSAGSVAAVLARVRPATVLLDVRDAPHPSWIDQPRAFGANMGAPYVMVPRQAFDAVVFFPTTTKAMAVSTPA